MVDRRKAILAAAAAGVVAASIAYLLYLRPQWRRQVVEVGRHLLNVAEGLIKRGADALPPADESARDA